MLNKLTNLRAITNYRRMWPIIRPYWFRALIAMLLCLPVGSMEAVIAYSLKHFMDDVLNADGVNSSSVWIVPIAIVGFTVVQGILIYSLSFLNTWLGARMSNDLRFRLYSKLVTFEPAFFDHQNSGDIVFRFHNDADEACSGVLDNVRLFVTRLFSSISLIVVLFVNSWQLSIITVVILAITFYPVTRVRNLIKNALRRSVNVIGMTITTLNEAYAGNRVIASYNYQPEFRSKFAGILKEMFRLSIKLTQRTAWLTPMMHITTSLGVAVAIGYGSYLIISGQLTTGAFVSFITALLMLYNPLKHIGNQYNKVEFSFMAMERCFEMLDRVPAIKDRDDAVELKEVRHGIEFRHVDFGYVPSRKVLKDISFKVNVGQSVALVGNSGGGKSTIAMLIPRFYDIQKGSILIDGIDVREMTAQSLRDKIAMVFQDNFLFDGTIRDNIRIGKPDATDAEIMAAVEKAYLLDFINAQREGLDVRIGERGVLLSGGQKQRVAIARALIKDAPIVILDEATSALDSKAEVVVQKAINNLMVDRTVFVIAHRLSTIRHADMILVVNEGEIVETGNHETLMHNRNGVYRALYEAQFQDHPLVPLPEPNRSGLKAGSFEVMGNTDV